MKKVTNILFVRRSVVICIITFGAFFLSVFEGIAEDKRNIVDANQPIEITSNNLEVRQDQNLAVFTGEVEAVQGRIKLTANEVKVWYQTASQGKNKVGGVIKRIDAFGEVFVSSPLETAQGSIGVYDVPAKVITLSGKVVLTKGENVIRGEKLILNMVTGHSIVEGGQRRVRGLFIPPNRNTE